MADLRTRFVNCSMGRHYAVITGFLAFAFFLRVLGQAFVAFWQVDFLPPMSEWYSGLVPYPLLLPIQVIIVALQARISHDLWCGRGFFAKQRPRPGRILCWLSYVYFAAMLLRYGLTMWYFPERRWLHGTIPIFFHWVLAAYLFVLGKYYRSTDE